MKVLGIDIDGVLADHISAFREFAEKERGISLKESDFVGYDGVVGLTKEDAEELFRGFFKESANILGIKPYPYARDLVESARSAGLNPVLLTARRSRSLGYTRSWCERHIADTGIHIIPCEGDEKLSFCDILIEDNPQNLDGGGDGKVRILVRRPWNKWLLEGGEIIIFSDPSKIAAFLPGLARE
jgi:5'(3')-deoxyribonucleotidase